MFEYFVPKKFCREFVEIKGYSVQSTMIMATVLGIKPCMDDWVRADKFEEYRKICKKYGLYIMPDTIFNVVENNTIPLGVIGRENLTTTKAFGSLFSKTKLKSTDKNDAVHIFISKSKKDLGACFKNGWYPLIIKNRVINKPLIDSFKFGYGLGYPQCCVAFFQKYNNWTKYSFLYEIYKNTPKGKYRYLCNPFTKDATYSYTYYMPCFYNCPTTLDLSAQIRAGIQKEEPEFVKAIDRHLKLPLLVFYERKFYAFEGEIKNNKIYYRKAYFIGQMPENNLYEADLNKGNCILLDDKDVVILCNGKLIKRIKWKKRYFAPEFPFIIQFH